MPASLAAGYYGESTVDAFLKRVGKEYPLPRIKQGRRLRNDLASESSGLAPMTLSPKAVEAAARAIASTRGQHDPERMISIGDDKIPLWKIYEKEARAGLAAALAVDGLQLVPTAEWPPFKPGDRVTHADLQEDGTVVGIDGGRFVVVEFDKPNRSGKKPIGKYDAAWFRSYPRGLVAAASTGDSPRQEKK